MEGLPQEFGWAILAKLLQAVGAVVAAFGFVLWVSKAPIGFGLTAIWSWIDAGRHMRLLGQRVAAVGTRFVFVLSVAAWVLVAVGVVFLAISPHHLVSLTLARLPDIGSRVAVEEIATAVRALMLPLAIGVPIFLVAFFIALSKDKGIQIVNRTIAVFGTCIVVWAAYEAMRFGTVIYGTFLPQLTQAYFERYADLAFIDLAAFVLLTTTLAAVPFAILLYFLPISLTFALEQVNIDFPFWLTELYERSLAPLTIFFAGLVTSFAVSLGAVYIGALVEGQGDLVLDPQVLASNAFFDGLTLSTTATILRWAALPAFALRDRPRLRPLLANYAERRAAHLANFSKRPSERDHSVGNPDWEISLDTRKWIMRYLPWFDFLDVNEKRALGVRYYGDIPAGKLAENIDGIEKVIGDLVKSKQWRIAPALLVDTFLACAYAYGSVYFAFLGTPRALTLPEMNYLFVGGFDGATFNELGPLFWLMHSSFLPTVCFWLLLALAGFAGYLVSPLVDFALRAGPANTAKEAASAVLKTAAFIAGCGGLIDAALLFHWIRA